MHCDKASNTVVHLYMSNVLGNSGTHVRDVEEHVKKAFTEEAELGPCRRNKNPAPPREKKRCKDILVRDRSPRDKDTGKQMGNWTQKEKGGLPPLGDMRAAWKFTGVKVTLGMQCGARRQSPEGCRWIWVLFHKQCRSHEGLLGEERWDLSLGVF